MVGRPYNMDDAWLGVMSPLFGGRIDCRGLEMGPLSSPVMTSYRLPIVTIGLSLTVFAVPWLVMDGCSVTTSNDIWGNASDHPCHAGINTELSKPDCWEIGVQKPCLSTLNVSTKPDNNFFELCWPIHNRFRRRGWHKFLPARRYASAGNRHSNVSVCLSVTRRYCVRTKKATGMISSPCGSPKTLVFWRQISSPNSKGFPPNGGSNKGRSEKFSDFLALSVSISKTVADTAIVTNRKSYIGFRLTPRSMTLDDLELL